MKSMKLAFFITAAVILLAACGQSSGTSNDGRLTLEQAPTDVAAIYKSNCIRCHAIDLSGKMGDVTNLQYVHERLSEEEIIERITNGGKTMPAFKERLSEQEIAALAAWLANQQ